jgi:hypothetical protein
MRGDERRDPKVKLEPPVSRVFAQPKRWVGNGSPWLLTQN